MSPTPTAVLVCVVSVVLCYLSVNTALYEAQMKSWVTSALEMVHNSHRPDQDYEWSGSDAKEKLFNKYRKRYSLLKVLMGEFPVVNI